jgi:excinuclease UvrABC nuclease subunit
MDNSFAVYRFLDDKEDVIYVGKSNTIRTRIYNQHFTKNGHLPYECYKKTAKVEIIPLNNSIECTSLEAYLINKYKPIYNTRDKERKLKLVTAFDDKLQELEEGNWKTYRTFRQLDKNKIRLKEKDTKVASYFAAALYICVITFLLVNYI